MSSQATAPAQLASITARLRARFRAWVHRRIPPSRSVTLDQKRIFIFPSGVGWFFGVCLFVMLLTAINYQNNMSYALTFLLFNLFVVAILHTYANLSGLTIQAVRAEAAFPGQLTEFRIRLQRTRRRPHYAIRVHWPGGSEEWVSLADQSSVDLHLHVPVGPRGWFHPGRLHIETNYPLGLLRAWTWIDLDLKALVYPQPLAPPDAEAEAGSADGGALSRRSGRDDFAGFRPYRPGDSLRQVYWKGVARGQELQSKQYHAFSARTNWISWDMYVGGTVEQRLSWLCHRLLECETKGEAYGLSLPGYELEPGQGELHAAQGLKALALYGYSESAD